MERRNIRNSLNETPLHYFKDYRKRMVTSNVQEEIQQLLDKVAEEF